MGQTDLLSGQADPVQELAKEYASGALNLTQYQAALKDPANSAAGLGGYKQEQGPNQIPYEVGDVGPDGKPIQASLAPITGPTGATTSTTPASPLPGLLGGNIDPASPTLPPTSGARVAPPTGPANDTNPGGQLPLGPTQTLPVNSPTGSTGSTTPGSPLASLDPRVGNGVSTTPTTPDTSLTNDTISVNPNVDRFAVANQQLQDTIKDTLDPEEAAQSRMIAAQSFGAGRVGVQARIGQPRNLAVRLQQPAQPTGVQLPEPSIDRDDR